ncbi:hypothetical protein ACH40F_44810 [Streptomyces sp. NPDC020794]|uniref:hypothetical protein n=1 Tax=unclassified Streptomyces TaxID=2593676 RepID=UPI0036E7C470
MLKHMNHVRAVLIAGAAVALLVGGTATASADNLTDDQQTTVTSSDDATFAFSDDAVSVQVNDGSGGGVQTRGGETSTKLTNGRLYFEGRNGRDVSGNSDYYYSATKYVKSAGSAVKVKLGLHTDNGEFTYPSSGWLGVGKGDTVQHSWGAKKVSGAGSCSVAGFLTADGQSDFFTPYVGIC